MPRALSHAENDGISAKYTSQRIFLEAEKTDRERKMQEVEGSLRSRYNILWASLDRDEGTARDRCHSKMELAVGEGEKQHRSVENAGRKLDEEFRRKIAEMDEKLN